MAHSKAYLFSTPYDIDHVVSKYGKSVAHPARVVILRWLAAEGPKHAGEIAKYLTLSPATTTHHLAVLERAGLVQSDERGPYIRYAFNEHGMFLMRSYFEEIFDEVALATANRQQTDQ